jgi:hypothetical protein
MTLWEFSAAVKGWSDVNCDKAPETLDNDEHDRLMAKYA